MNYYNEIEPYPAQWLRNLVEAGLIPSGEIDERSIVDVQPEDLEGFEQCHFFAGIGGWSLALQLAGWPSTEPVWTGSCPCQPFSVAGRRKGNTDERHLWPEFFRLIKECRPATVFGEQVASPLGRSWLAGVRLQMEALGFGVGAADLCAAGIGAPHIRQRLWWVADADNRGPKRNPRTVGGEKEKSESEKPKSGRFTQTAWNRGQDVRLADADKKRREGERLRLRKKEGGRVKAKIHEASGDSEDVGVGDAYKEGPQRRGVRPEQEPSERSPWTPSIAIPCTDGKARRIGPGIMPLAHGVPARVGKIRAFGNAIVPQVAAEFVKACR
ncbi:site-specific DNA methylase [uncultured Mediterranean phage uvDeep-CGR2-AD3-C191]|nr:site-specific DNA methylase [uncultured Mediterranean phage uvDeep-CGR2-AD3-C191]